MPAQTFGAVLFDLDGVLVDSELLANGVWVALLDEHGLTIEQGAFMARAVGSTHRALFNWLREEYSWEKPEGFLPELDARLAQAFRATPTIEGARETLEALRRADRPFAVASNSLRSRLHLKLEASGLAALVGEHAYDPAHVGGRGKPLPDLYEHAARALGVSPTRCLVVEDSAAGVTAGVAAGATVWGLLAGGHIHPDTGEALRRAGAARLLTSHEELRRELGPMG
ncbi:HAD family hydrolase [Deinococcus hopiensis]|uniref:Haloacid dehalogenase superfamily, subfamily IA, variant 3 with third motif having DD or ED n=1 Tax=Deinococcus hopiensis KR-140 TaxID=695939 RepID=A0A1W1VCE1_9DEIO|nr:HAD-IA family hydrolase [Deinococcus hopiensis]SMB90721.1 haloacid dehalogenase superfamily, subfamily IA, variant 3 with third motif having DD or ED [Deinococcus hopiensis KR-140]